MPLLKAGLCQALTPDVLSTFRDSNIRNVEDFIAADLEDLSRKSGVPYKELISIKRVVLAQYSAFPVSGKNLYDEVLTSISILPTGNYGLSQQLFS